MAVLIRKQDSTVFCQQETHLPGKETQRPRVNIWKYVQNNNNNNKQTGKQTIKNGHKFERGRKNIWEGLE